MDSVPGSRIPRLFIRGFKLRNNLLPTQARIKRRLRDGPSSCRAGCQSSESLPHIIQRCFRTHGARVKRHNHLLKRLLKCVEKKSSFSALEPQIPSGKSFVKPDILAVFGSTAIIIDVQICNDFNAAESFLTKVTKYGSPDVHGNILKYIRRLDINVQHLFHFPFIVSFRGIFMINLFLPLCHISSSVSMICMICLFLRS